MRIANSHLLEDKMDEAVTHYINSHQASEQTVNVDANTLALNVQDDGGGRVVTVMHSQNFPTQMCRQISVGEQVGEGPWGDELLDHDGRIAALMAQLAQHSRNPPQLSTLHKIPTLRGDVDTTVLLDTQMRIFNGTLEQPSESLVSQVPPLQPLPPLQNMKRCPETSWFDNKNKTTLKVQTNSPMLAESEGTVIEIAAGASPAPSKQQNKKSLPHKKRISRKLKRHTGNSTPQQDIVVINSNEEVVQEEILPDNFEPDVHQQEHLAEETHHIITHGVRSVFICQLCGDYYGEEQFKFFQHLKQHYEPHATIIIENPVSDLGIDKMTNTCIVDNVTTLPDAIVELSLDNTVPKTIYQPIDKHILYTSSDKTLDYSNNKIQYSMASIDKDANMASTEVEKGDLYDTLDKLDFYTCTKCNKTFKKQKQCEAHIKEAHCNTKIEDMEEFSEPEDLMEGIHVSVEEGGEPYDSALLPHLTVENGQVHQEHVRQWYIRNSASPPSGLAPCTQDDAYYPVCPAAPPPPAPPAPPPPPPPPPSATPAHETTSPTALKEEVLHRIFEVEVATETPININDNLIPDNPEVPSESAVNQIDIKIENIRGSKKKTKMFECPHCGRVFGHRNSLLYHVLSHTDKQHPCRECGKNFYTPGALKIHKRVHNGDRPYKCDECGREFRQWSDLKYHKISLHSDQKHFKCEFCGKEFARKYSLSVHRRIHTGERNYKCEYCNKSFRASSYRLSHMRTHTGDKPYKCEECEKCFRVAGDLRRHLLTHQKIRNRFNEKKVKEKYAKKNPVPTQKLNDSRNEENAEESEQNVMNSESLRRIDELEATSIIPNKCNLERKTQRLIKKNQIKKLSAPNVTVEQNRINVGKLNIDLTNNGTYSKFKGVYNDHDIYNEESKDGYNQSPLSDEHKDQKLIEDRDFPILRPMRNQVCDNPNDRTLFIHKTEDPNGKITVFTHIEKNKDYNSPIVTNSQVALSEIRHLERDVISREVRTDVLHNDGIENGFLERLTALYNIPAV